MSLRVERWIALWLALALILVLPVSADNGPNHRTPQVRPISLGVSGGNMFDSSALFCCGGTLGSLVTGHGGRNFILSNNHVLARVNQASPGEHILQPGLIDQNPACAKDPGDIVADLSIFVPISFAPSTTNMVDAAIAEVRPGAVDLSGTILDIGPVSHYIAAPALGMPVKKSGRTTGLTTGTIAGLNATVDVTYSQQCGVGSQVARFVGQIVIGPGGFSAGGDSGSLIVQDTAGCPHAVGLLFAGSSTVTIANPISDVLAALGVSMPAGCTTFSSSSGLPVPSGGSVPAVDVSPQQLVNAQTVRARHEADLFKVSGVRGVALGVSQSGDVAIHAYVVRATRQVRRALPASLEGVPVQVIETGEIVAYQAPGSARCGQ